MSLDPNKCPYPYCPHETAVQKPMTVREWQERALQEGFKYWRAPDAHGVTCTKDQAANMLAAVLGVEVEIGA